MDRITRLVEQLRSSSKDKRYEASEWLRVIPTLPRTALDALEQATRDPDPLVADSARRAVALHSGPDSGALPSAAGSVLDARADSILGQPYLVGPAAALVAYAVTASFPILTYHCDGCGITFRWVRPLGMCVIGLVAPLVLGLLCGVFARRAQNPGIVAAVAGAVLGSAAGIFAALLGWMPE